MGNFLHNGRLIQLPLLISFFFFFLQDFTCLFESEHARAGWGAEGDTDSPLNREPEEGLHLGTPGSWPKPEAETYQLVAFNQGIQTDKVLVHFKNSLVEICEAYFNQKRTKLLLFLLGLNVTKYAVFYVPAVLARVKQSFSHFDQLNQLYQTFFFCLRISLYS